jgi:hypothetical protein
LFPAAAGLGVLGGFLDLTHTFFEKISLFTYTFPILEFTAPVSPTAKTNKTEISRLGTRPAAQVF